MEWMQLPLGRFQTNCYIVWQENQEALIIDPGAEPEQVNQFLNNKGLTPQAILLTHAHLDHIGAVGDLRMQWGIPVYVHELEADWLLDPEKNGSAHFPGFEPIRLKQAERYFAKEEEIKISSFVFSLLETPGHSPGGVSFYFQDQQVVFSGDCLFNGSIGRTDLYGGNLDELMATLEQKLLTLPGETVVCSGHGFDTTIQHEKETNPFLL